MMLQNGDKFGHTEASEQGFIAYSKHWSWNCQDCQRNVSNSPAHQLRKMSWKVKKSNTSELSHLQLINYQQTGQLPTQKLYI